MLIALAGCVEPAWGQRVPDGGARDAGRRSDRGASLWGDDHVSSSFGSIRLTPRDREMLHMNGLGPIDAGALHSAGLGERGGLGMRGTGGGDGAGYGMGGFGAPRGRGATYSELRIEGVAVRWHVVNALATASGRTHACLLRAARTMPVEAVVRFDLHDGIAARELRVEGADAVVAACITEGLARALFSPEPTVSHVEARFRYGVSESAQRDAGSDR